MPTDGCHTGTCLEYAARTGKAFCIVSCSDEAESRSPYYVIKVMSTHNPPEVKEVHTQHLEEIRQELVDRYKVKYNLNDFATIGTVVYGPYRRID